MSEQTEQTQEAADKAEALIKDRQAKLDLFSHVIDNISCIAGLSHGEVLQVCYTVGVNAAIAGFNGNREAALAFVDSYMEEKFMGLGYVRPEKPKGTTLLLPPGVSRQ